MTRVWPIENPHYKTFDPFTFKPKTIDDVKKIVEIFMMEFYKKRMWYDSKR